MNSLHRFIKTLLFLKHTFTLQNFILVGIFATGISCSLTTEEISTDPSHRLRFSTDTIFFDTIFSEIPSITKRLRVYNDNSKAISIAAISFAEPNSAYTLTVNGLKNTVFANTRILANDSILVLVEANINFRDNDSPYIVEDQIQFNTNGNNQEVSILSWGQDAYYIKDSVLACNTTWKAGKPYVIYDHMLIDSLCTLTIEAGTQVFSHLGSNIYVKGSLIVKGTADERVVFMNDRFDGDYANYPGQWGGIIFLEGSKDNEISYTDIQNADVGIWLGTPDDDNDADLVLENSSIENMLRSAILAFTSDLRMTNCLLDNTGEIVFAGLAGGNYTLQHNTIANYGVGFFKTQPVFVITDQLQLADGNFLEAPVMLNLTNNIIWGSSDSEIELLNDAGQDFALSMSNNLLRTNQITFQGFDNIINDDPLFIAPVLFDYQLDSLSPAIHMGADLGTKVDLLGKVRSTPPDIGAYERQ